MIKTIQIIATIILTFTLPMLTSWLLDWWWIAEKWPRYTLVIVLMVVEFAIGVLILKMIAKDVVN